MAKPDGIHFYARRDNFFGDTIGILMYSRTPSGTAIAKPVELWMRTEEELGIEPPSTFSIDRDAGQRLMDELWSMGLRPSEGSGSAGSLAATERHLADMRALVFKQTPKT